MTKQIKKIEPSLSTEKDLSKEIKKTLKVTWDKEPETQHFFVYINGEKIDSKFSTAFDRDKAISRIENGLDWK